MTTIAILLSNQKLKNSLNRLKSLTNDSPAQQKNIRELEIKIDKSLEIFEKTLKLAQTNKIESPQFIAGFNEGRRTMNSVRFKIMEMTAHESDILGIRQAKSSKTLSTAPLIVYYVLILSLIVLSAS